MKLVAPLLVLYALLHFTAPNGKAIYFTREEIVSIADPATCAMESGARIMTTMGSFCIRETVDEAVKQYLVEPAK